MIHREIKVTVRERSVTLDSDIIIYRGDGNILFNFEILDGRYKYRAENLIEHINAIRADATIMKADKQPIRSRRHNIKDSIVPILISKDMIDAMEEVGTFKMQIHLYDEENNRVSLPPFTLEVNDCIGEVESPKDDMYYGRITLNETGVTNRILQPQEITEDMIKNATDINIETCKTLSRTSLGQTSSDYEYYVVALPTVENLKATIDNGLGGKVKFITDYSGSNGEIKIMINDIEYDLYCMYLPNKAEIFIYVDNK